MSSILPVSFRADQAQEQFVRELGRLQRQLVAELAQVLAGNRADLRVYELGQALGGGGVATAPGVEQARDVACGRRAAGEILPLCSTRTVIHVRRCVRHGAGCGKSPL